MHITKSPALCISNSPFRSSQKDCYLENFFHFVEHTQKSTSTHPLQKTATSVITLSLTLLTSSTFSHSSSFTITPTPPQLISFLSFPASYHPVLSISPASTSIILFLSTSQTYPPFPLRLPKLHVPTCTPKRLSGLLPL